jgi:hypothetical protein
VGASRLSIDKCHDIDTYAYATTNPYNSKHDMYRKEFYPDLLTFNVILLASPDPDEPATEAVPDIPASTGVVTSHSSTEARVIGTGTCEGPG